MNKTLMRRTLLSLATSVVLMGADRRPAPPPTWVFSLGPRLRKLMYGRPMSDYNPRTVLSNVATLMLHGREVTFTQTSMNVTGLDGFGRYHLRQLIRSYEE